MQDLGFSGFAWDLQGLTRLQTLERFTRALQDSTGVVKDLWDLWAEALLLLFDFAADLRLRWFKIESPVQPAKLKP